MILWRVKNKNRTEYIRAKNLDEAKKIFDNRNLSQAVEFQPTEEKIQAVYFTDSLSDPAYFKGTKTEVRKSAKLYIKQWGLDATIEKIETL